MRKAAALIVTVLVGGLIRADAPSPAPEVLVAEAASLYASLSYGERDEEQAIRKLASALREDPANRQAQGLLAAIQKRREERRKRQEQQGQQQIARQSEGRREPQQQEGRQDDQQQGERGSASRDAELAERKPDEGRQAGDERQSRMSRAEAERLLEALEAQEQRPLDRPKVRAKGSQSPRW